MHPFDVALLALFLVHAVVFFFPPRRALFALLLAWVVFCLVAMLTMARPAAAQTGSDCSFGAFPMRAYPRAVITETMSAAYKDPLNIKFGQMHGRCEKNPDRVAVCTRYARMNSVGYLTDSHWLFGIYHRTAARFEPLLIDDLAAQACRNRVYQPH